ncbi:MAG TPA: DoxX family protein [Polyangia bacterium]|nr:DoxX family protein [Polyangia bacterium]
MREQTWVAALVPMRIVTGWLFLMASLQKLMGHWLDEPKLQGILEGWIKEGRPYGFYAPFLAHVALPHAKLFSCLIVGGELSVGAALLAGLFTRPACTGGLLLVLNIFLGHGDGLSLNATALSLLILFTLLLTHPGRTLGLDAALRGKVPRWLS